METITNEKEQIEEIFTEETLHNRKVSNFVPKKLNAEKSMGFVQFWLGLNRFICQILQLFKNNIVGLAFNFSFRTRKGSPEKSI